MCKKSINAVSLQLKNRIPYQRNLRKILRYIDRYSDRDIILAPEVSLTDYDYENIDSAVEFGKTADTEIANSGYQGIFAYTRLIKRDDGYYNEAVVFHRGRVVHRQAKHKLFLLGNEHKYLKAGRRGEIVKFKIDGIIYGLLVCFELRYKDLWQEMEGCDVILLPAQWGVSRKRHLEILSSALAIMNQCYVLLSNSASETMACSSGLYTPSGGVVRDDFLEAIECTVDLELVKKIKRHIRM